MRRQCRNEHRRNTKTVVRALRESIELKELPLVKKWSRSSSLAPLGRPPTYRRRACLDNDGGDGEKRLVVGVLIGEVSGVLMEMEGVERRCWWCVDAEY